VAGRLAMCLRLCAEVGLCSWQKRMSGVIVCCLPSQYVTQLRCVSRPRISALAWWYFNLLLSQLPRERKHGSFKTGHGHFPQECAASLLRKRAGFPPHFTFGDRDREDVLIYRYIEWCIARIVWYFLCRKQRTQTIRQKLARCSTGVAVLKFVPGKRYLASSPRGVTTKDIATEASYTRKTGFWNIVTSRLLEHAFLCFKASLATAVFPRRGPIRTRERKTGRPAGRHVRGQAVTG
jgi:hypothetical protein